MDASLLPSPPVALIFSRNGKGGREGITTAEERPKVAFGDPVLNGHFFGLTDDGQGGLGHATQIAGQPLFRGRPVKGRRSGAYHTCLLIATTTGRERPSFRGSWYTTRLRGGEMSRLTTLCRGLLSRGESSQTVVNW